MKILFFSRLFWPHIGGIEKHIEEISKILIKNGHKITIVTTAFDPGLKTIEVRNGIKILRFKQPEIKYLGIIYTWFWLLTNFDLIKKSDIVHIHDVFIWYWPFKVLFPSKKVYTTFHGRWGKYPIPLPDVIQKRIGAKLSTGLITIGEYINKYYSIRSDIVSYGAVTIPKEKTRKDPKLVLYVGRLDKDTGLEKILSVFVRLKNYKIIFCGDGELKSNAEEFGEVLGFVDPEPYYKKATYVFASGYLTILEALANNCVVFTAYDNPLQKDYYRLTPFRGCIFTSKYPKKLFNKFMYLAKHASEREKIASKGYALAKKYSWEKLSENYIKLWEN